MAGTATLRFEPGRIIAWTCLFLGGIVMILPFVYMLATSLKDGDEEVRMAALDALGRIGPCGPEVMGHCGFETSTLC